MSVVQRVIILNKPFKIRGYTVMQWIILAVALAVAFLVGSKTPGDWKLGHMPLGFIIGLVIFCLAIVFVSATQMRPVSWWKNLIMYKLGLSPTVYLPNREPATLHYDPTIIEAPKAEDQPYVTFEQ